MENQSMAVIEEKLRKYYRHKYELERLENSLNRLIRHKLEIQRDIDTSNISFGTSVPSIDYSKDKIKVINTTSPQEREIDKAFARLERALKKIDDEILETNDKIRGVEADITDMEFIINDLEQEAKMFLELRYRYLKSNYIIAKKLNMSEASIRRLREKIMDEMVKWLL